MLDRDTPQTVRDGDEGEAVEDTRDRTARAATLEREIDRLEAELSRKDARIEAIIRQYEGLLDEKLDDDPEPRTDGGRPQADSPLEHLRAAVVTLLS